MAESEPAGVIARRMIHALPFDLEPESQELLVKRIVEAMEEFASQRVSEALLNVDYDYDR